MPCLLKIYINGKLYDKEDAKISVYDHGLLYGDGVFEGMRSLRRQGVPAAGAPRTAVEFGQGHLAGNPHDARTNWRRPSTRPLEANGIEDGYMRLVVTRGAGTLGLDPNRCSDPQVIIIADYIALYPEEFYEKGWRSSPSARSATTRRPSARGSSR